MKKALLILAGSAALVLPPVSRAEVAAQGTAPAHANLLSMPSIAMRMQRDHRIENFEEKFNNEGAKHVGLFMSDQSVPYSVTLGWFNDSTGMDDFGERMPDPGQKPNRSAFDKADLANIRGFDAMTDGNAKQALAAFEEAVKGAPKSPKAHNNLGVCLALFQQAPRAQTEFDTAIKLKPDYAAALTNKAWLELATSNQHAAITTAKKALGLKPNFKPALLALTKAYLLNELIQDAKLAGQECARRWPNDAVALELAAEATLASGDVKQAKQYLLKYSMLNPRDINALMKIAQIYQQLGDVDNGLKYGKAATAVNPDSSAAHLLLGRVMESNRDPRPAELQYQRAMDVAKTPQERIAAQGPLLRVLFEQKKFPDADKLSKKWAVENATIADCHYNRAWVCSQIGGAPAKTEAVQEYRKALALKPQMAEIHYNLGLLLADQGNKSDASKELKLFIEQSPADPDIQKARELLGKFGH